MAIRVPISLIKIRWLRRVCIVLTAPVMWMWIVVLVLVVGVITLPWVAAYGVRAQRILRAGVKHFWKTADPFQGNAS